MRPDHKQEIFWILRDKYRGKYSPEIVKDVRRLKAGEPTDYIIGWTPFLNCRIDLSYKPMIPRPETEYWTEKAIAEIKKRKSPVRIADVFGGSGCIGIAVLKNAGKAKVDFAEVEPRFVKQIKLNLKLNKITRSRYRVIRSDVFEKIKEKYDFILANPPYVAAGTPKLGMMKYEPSRAFFAGRGGLRYARKFLKAAPDRLEPEGEIWMEFGTGQKAAIEKLLETSGYGRRQFLKDQYKRGRYLRAFAR